MVSINPPDSVIKKVSVWCGGTCVVGIQMFNQKGVSVLEIGKKVCDKFDVDLADGERIVGIWSRLLSQCAKAHRSLTFIIGRLEKL